MSDAMTLEVEALIRQWQTCYRTKDADALMALASGDDVVLVGTGADEVRFGLAAAREQLERDFGQTDDVELTFDNLRINPAGDSVAFVYGDAVVAGSAGGEAFEMSGLRFTFGLIRTALGWRFAQVHVSVPNTAQDDGSSI